MTDAISRAIQRHGHGNYNTYNAGCRCYACTEANRHARRRSENSAGVRVTVDTTALRRELSASGRSDVDIERAAGLARGQICAILKRGRCGFYMLDNIAVVLGCHVLGLLADPEYVYGEVVACHG